MWFSMGLMLVGIAQAGPAEKELKKLDKSCKAGDAADCFRLGEMLDYGGDVPRDRPRAGIAYDRACEAGNLDACNALGHLIDDGSVDDPRSAVDLFSASCADWDGADLEAIVAHPYRSAVSNGCLHAGWRSSDPRELFDKACRATWDPVACFNSAVGAVDAPGLARWELVVRACNLGHVQTVDRREPMMLDEAGRIEVLSMLPEQPIPIRGPAIEQGRASTAAEMLHTYCRPISRRLSSGAAVPFHLNDLDADP